jgi:hypothetical protein
MVDIELEECGLVAEGMPSDETNHAERLLERRDGVDQRPRNVDERGIEGTDEHCGPPRSVWRDDLCPMREMRRRCAKNRRTVCQRAEAATTSDTRIAAIGATHAIHGLLRCQCGSSMA